MPIDAKFFTLLIFVAINFCILFFVKTRTTTVISLIIAHLVAVLFFSLSISNYNSFKEIVLALIIYSMVALFLISNYNSAYLTFDRTSRTNLLHKFSLPLISVASAIILVIFFSLTLVTKNVTQISEALREKKSSKQNEVMQNPMILPSHPVHIAVKKFYLGKKFEEDEWSDKTLVALELSERKKARLKDRLSDNFLFKRSSDAILIIVAVTSSLLLLARKEPN